MPTSEVCTVYVRNLNEKVSVSRLKSLLEELFRNRGFDVIDVAANKNLRMKGQAFVTLKDGRQAKLAVQVFNSIVFMDNMMEVQIAKSDSDKAREVKGQTHDLESLQAERQARREQRMSANPSKRRRDDLGGAPATKRTKNMAMEPNHILLLTSLPSGTTEEHLTAVFKPYKGFQDITLVSVRNLCLVEFRSETEASICLNKLGRDVAIKGEKAQLEYAKK